MKNAYRVIHTVLVTEKGTVLSEGLQKFVFRVDPGANKIEIRNAVEKIFDVKVGAVNVMNYLGKQKRFKQGRIGKRSDWKKAIVTLTEGSIDII